MPCLIKAILCVSTCQGNTLHIHLRYLSLAETSLGTGHWVWQKQQGPRQLVSRTAGLWRQAGQVLQSLLLQTSTISRIYFGQDCHLAIARASAISFLSALWGQSEGQGSWLELQWLWVGKQLHWNSYLPVAAVLEAVDGYGWCGRDLRSVLEL